MPPKKVTSGGKKGKVSPYNAYMKRELAKLKESKPDMAHKDRFSAVAKQWATAPENPKNKA
ncbi:hypothetical protein FA09DRAFT_361076 [Tilletiopsis washingtonensis]|uniref:YABBY protein C-terminal domain-containing protein n=1 Tax=Tilletiopsis washingtonensis TaxID=58919 RepID=A0A316ZC15_9BASI|nr:hypothetical protein FA09DRAFT_361076 [Tilletiopsis washingtonensis]PWN97773.1 hypothetical protein FA09DRAFT_361076 [Tilletiopsis washingtonensis]